MVIFRNSICYLLTRFHQLKNTLMTDIGFIVYLRVGNVKLMWHTNWGRGLAIVLNVTFNNISVITWQSVLLVEETGVLGENH